MPEQETSFLQCILESAIFCLLYVELDPDTSNLMIHKELFGNIRSYKRFKEI
jgi:hypothetical protein